MSTQHENASPSREIASKETSSQEGFEGGLVSATRPGDNQQHVQLAANASAPVQQLKAFQAAASNSPQVHQLKAMQAGVSSAIQRRENKTGLPDQLKSGVEGLSGMAMDDVKVHYNSDKPAQLQAHAYAQGTDIHVAPGQEQHLPHEAWHVVQQKQGRVQATTQLKGKVAVNDDAGLENEADVMGAKAMQLKADGNGSGVLHQTESKADIVQRVNLTEAGEAYKERIKTTTDWGGSPEAHAIAAQYEFVTHIYRLEDGEEEGQVLRLVEQVGAGTARALSLLWDGTHYKVLNCGGDQDGAVYGEAKIAHDPVGDGNCMYEGLFYILRMGAGNVGRLLEESSYRNQVVSNMRNTAANNMDNMLLNILGEEREGHEDFDRKGNIENDKNFVGMAKFLTPVYEAFPPSDYMIKEEKKEDKFMLRNPSGKSAGEKVRPALVKLFGSVKLKVESKQLLEIIAALKSHQAYKEVEKSSSSKKEPKRIISSAQWDHITKGGTKEDGRPTGLHTIHGSGQIAEGFGTKTPVGDLGCYTQSVRLISDGSKVKKVDSTFFPDSWSLEDIREAIEFAYIRKPYLEVSTPEKGKGMILFFNGESYFPFYG